jgi:hypothetical protein
MDVRDSYTGSSEPVAIVLFSALFFSPRKPEWFLKGRGKMEKFCAAETGCRTSGSVQDNFISR